ncbi:hypothetical protein DCO48_05740 [Pseudomonas sp. SDI]|uniref:hypothetical protein n=1 Tax=Pseudomonas sp. SDI TaxID=2170734 RepID=UPI000DE79E11|nr:hypothetical protein [Pseudomonas sp. SDI]PWB34645.1 hypothetical protein DCO48_05740 [Pseudomonas sp. SDI]
MQTLPLQHHLSLASSRALAHQVVLNGTFDHDLIDGVTGAVCGLVRVVVEQCQKGLIARVELSGSVNTITFARRPDNSMRLTRFIESLANGVDLPIDLPEVDEFLLVSELESMLRCAVRERRGTYYLPVDGVEGLALLLRQSACDPKRAAFRFELAGGGLTMPVLLPSDRTLAYELLNGCVQEFVANYRTAA